MMNKPAIAIIQARMSSSRLPGKVMKPLAGKPVVWHIYERALRCQRVDKVIVATSNDRTDDPLADFCNSNNMILYRGSLNNVMSRFIDVLNENNYPYFVRITGDCPLIHPVYIDEKIRALTKFDADITWSGSESSLLEGQGVQSTRSLFHIAEISSSPEDLEHVGSVYMAENPDDFKIVEIELPDIFIKNSFRLTIDEEKDYHMFNKIFDALYDGNDILELTRVIHWINKNEDVLTINKDVSHKALNIKLREIRKKWVDSKKTGKMKLNI